MPLVLCNSGIVNGNEIWSGDYLKIIGLQNYVWVAGLDDPKIALWQP
jgi:hypothetical protein